MRDTRSQTARSMVSSACDDAGPALLNSLGEEKRQRRQDRRGRRNWWQGRDGGSPRQVG